MFKGLKSYAKKGVVQLQINSVVEGEVRGHIQERVTNAVRGINKAIKEPAFAGFKHIPGYMEKVEKLNVEEWVNKAQTEFETLLADCGIKQISVNGIDMEKIMNDYFNQKPPFESKKPDEFKDAIAVASIVEEAKKLAEDEVYCVISNDNGFNDAIKQNVQVPVSEDVKSTVACHNERLQLFDNLRTFLDYLNKLKKRSEYLAAFLQNVDVSYDIEATIRCVLERIDYQFEDIEPWIEEKGVIDIDEIEFKTYVLDVYDDDTAAISLDAKAIVKLEYSYTDENESFFDKEDHQYLWQTIIENEGTYEVKFEMVLLLDVSECGNSIGDDTEITDDIEFSEDDYVKIIDVIEEPETICLEERHCLETENISTSGPMHDYEPEDVYREWWGHAYTVCPGCGKPIGHWNDGGDGFCTKCALEH